MKLTQRLVDIVIRRRAQLHAMPLDRFTVRVARTVDDYQQAFRLLHNAFVHMGYESVRAPDMRITPQHVLPEAIVLVACDGDRVVGTLTVNLDSPAGLPIEEIYGDEVQLWRNRGARLVEYGSLAVLGREWHTGVTLLLYMAAYHIAYHRLHATHCIIQVVPKGVAIYRALFDFVPLGPNRRHPGFHDVELSSLIHDMGAVQSFVRRHYRKKMATGRLPIDHWLGEPPPCVELPPPMSDSELLRWRMPREVFQELFDKQSDRLATLNPTARTYLLETRSRETLNLSRENIAPTPASLTGYPPSTFRGRPARTSTGARKVRAPQTVA